MLRNVVNVYTCTCLNTRVNTFPETLYIIHVPYTCIQCTCTWNARYEYLYMYFPYSWTLVSKQKSTCTWTYMMYMYYSVLQLLIEHYVQSCGNEFVSEYYWTLQERSSSRHTPIFCHTCTVISSVECSLTLLGVRRHASRLWWLWQQSSSCGSRELSWQDSVSLWWLNLYHPSEARLGLEAIELTHVRIFHMHMYIIQ